jgi:hypothetical protein
VGRDCCLVHRRQAAPDRERQHVVAADVLKVDLRVVAEIGQALD